MAHRPWVRHLTFHIAIGNNDAHAKNIALIHEAGGTRPADVYDAVPNLFQDGLVTWDLARATPVEREPAARWRGDQ